MRVVSEIRQSPVPTSQTPAFEDLDEAGRVRTLEIVGDDAPNAMRVHSGDVQAVINATEGGALFRYVTFPAGKNVDELARGYTAGFGDLAAPMAIAKAILLDDAHLELVSLSVWRDRDHLEEFLQHPEFEGARARVGPHAGGPPKAENLRRL